MVKMNYQRRPLISNQWFPDAVKPNKMSACFTYSKTLSKQPFIEQQTGNRLYDIYGQSKIQPDVINFFDCTSILQNKPSQ